MGYDRNAKAYIILSKIEIGIREFLIKIIIERGVHDWAKTFLAKVHQDTIKDIGERIHKSSIENLIPDIEDVFVIKINRERKNSFSHKSKLLHPFYFLSWNDLLNLIEKKQNQKLLETLITNSNLNILKVNLTSLNFLRNDVAHARFISEEEMCFIEGAFYEIQGLIPEFIKFTENQSEEESIEAILNKVLSSIKKIESKSILKSEEIDKLIEIFFLTKNSFWLNSLNYKTELLEELYEQMKNYKILRNKPGGLLLVQKWKRENATLLLEINKNF
jgi:hypothetical protein